MGCTLPQRTAESKIDSQYYSWPRPVYGAVVKDRTPSRQRDDAVDDDVSDLRWKIQQIERLQERIATLRIILARARAELEGVPYIEVREVPPFAMTFAPPAPRLTSPSSRRKKPSESTEEHSSRPPTTTLLVPIPVKIVDQRVLCRYGHRTISLPLVDEQVILPSGLRATVQKVATTRFKGLAVRTIVEVPPKPRGRPKRKNGRR